MTALQKERDDLIVKLIAARRASLTQSAAAFQNELEYVSDQIAAEMMHKTKEDKQHARGFIFNVALLASLMLCVLAYTQWQWLIFAWASFALTCITCVCCAFNAEEWKQRNNRLAELQRLVNADTSLMVAEAQAPDAKAVIVVAVEKCEDVESQ